MPKVFKVRDEDSSGNVFLWASDASIVNFDSTDVENLEATNVRDAIKSLNTKAEGRAQTQTFTATINASAFEGDTAPYTQTISVPGIRGTDTPDIGVALSSDIKVGLAQREAFGCITVIQTDRDSIVVKCYEDLPTVDIPIQIRVVR